MKIRKKKQILGFDDIWLLLIGIPIVSLMMPLLFVSYSGVRAAEAGWYETSVLITFIHTCIYIFVFREIFVFVRQKFPLFEDTGKRILIQLTVTILSYLILDLFVVKTIVSALTGIADILTGVSVLLTSLAMVILVVAIYEGIYFYQTLKQERFDSIG